MSIKLIDEQIPQTNGIEEEVAPLSLTDLPYDDGEPLETNRHRIAMNVLINSLHQAYGERDDYYSGGNMFLYYSKQQVKNKDFRGPDFFAVLDVDGTRERRSWIVWDEQGRYPDAIVELMSDSTADIDRNEKKTLYEQTFQTPDYFIYDPYDRDSLQGWHLGANGTYQSLVANDRGWLWCESLGLWLGVWDGVLTKEQAPWLRFYDPDGNLVLLPEEVALLEQNRAERQRERAEREQERAEREQERAEREQERAEREQERASMAEENLQQTEAALAQERQQNQELQAYLQELEARLRNLEGDR
ncbi:Uma2 family endonuclease [Roseofilum casamattae]|uniref:Uma2 family endonuclease n=1 Tax=Roseofilum casamattae BLCC-M143 TaxID=3022442 RepID=A0ABT7BRA9_9CYAN|nr:Uma2 family endonuclease [Roseofilum casamattae]MDJ1181728.1 Uma2 family endonuclease [Roseofilum casamattae BLCC-M143]